MVGHCANWLVTPFARGQKETRLAQALAVSPRLRSAELRFASGASGSKPSTCSSSATTRRAGGRLTATGLQGAEEPRRAKLKLNPTLTPSFSIEYTSTSALLMILAIRCTPKNETLRKSSAKRKRKTTTKTKSKKTTKSSCTSSDGLPDHLPLKLPLLAAARRRRSAEKDARLGRLGAISTGKSTLWGVKPKKRQPPAPGILQVGPDAGQSSMFALRRTSKQKKRTTPTANAQKPWINPCQRHISGHLQKQLTLKPKTWLFLCLGKPADGWAHQPKTSIQWNLCS